MRLTFELADALFSNGCSGADGHGRRGHGDADVPFPPGGAPLRTSVELRGRAGPHRGHDATFRRVRCLRGGKLRSVGVRRHGRWATSSMISGSPSARVGSSIEYYSVVNTAIENEGMREIAPWRMDRKQVRFLTLSE